MRKVFNIHNHSTYSIFDGVSPVEDWAKYISKNNENFHQGLSLSEHGVLNGCYETFNFSKKNGLKYVPSVEFYIVPNDTDLTEKKVERFHLLVLGVDLDGYKQIVKINNLAIKRKQYILSRTGKFFICITPDIIKEVIGDNKGHLLCFGACIQGYWNKPIVEGNEKLATKRLIEMLEIFGESNVYLESQTFDSHEQKIVNRFNKRMEKEVGLKCVITSDAHIIRREDTIYQALATIMLFKNNLAGYNAMLSKEGREIEYRSWYKNYNELLYDVENYDLGLNEDDLNRYCDNLDDIFEMISSDVDLTNEQKFVYGDGDKEKNLAKFEELICSGWEFRFGDKKVDEKYFKRLEYEMDIIKQKGFVDYFLEVREIIQLGLENDIIFGVGRGSGASSLVSYLLEITNVDPLKYGLIFERFITPTRKDYPDIDCLSENTVIRTETGNKKIKDVKVGDLVYDINNELKLVLNKATRTVRDNEEVFSILIEHKEDIGVIFCSSNHRFFTKDGVKRASELREEFDLIKTGDNEYARLIYKNINNSAKEMKLVDIEVEETSSFQVIPFKNSDEKLVNFSIVSHNCDLSDRAKLISLMKEKYPNKDVVVIANKGKFGLKTITNSIFKALDISYPYEDYFKSSQYYTKIIEKYELDNYDVDKFFELNEIKDLVQAFNERYNYYDLRKIYDLYLKNLNNVGVHAGGVCILDNNQDMIPYIPVKSEDYDFATAYSESGSYKELEEMGEIKFDLLGVKTLNIFNDCINYIGDQSLRKLLFFNEKDINVNDKEVYKRISTTLTDGIFQLGSDGMKNLIKILDVDNIEDLSILIALYRPGTLNAGVQNTIGKAKKDLEYGKSLWDKKVLPLIDDVIKNTYYHILYQEQVMFIGQRIGDYNMAELNDFRKFISNKNLKDVDPEKYEILKEKFYSTFISNGKRKGIDGGILEELWAKLEGFSAYSFVFAHSLSYSHNAFLCAYFATYYPTEWYSALLKTEKTSEFVPIILDQIKKLKQNISIKSPKLNFSKHEPTIIGSDIILGFDTILGIGDKASIELMNLPHYNSFDEFITSDAYSKRAVNKGVVESLILAGFFDDVEDDRIDLLYSYIMTTMTKKKAAEFTRENFVDKYYGFRDSEDMFLFNKEMEKLGFPLRDFPKQDFVDNVWDNILEDADDSIRYDIIFDFDKILKKKSKKGTFYHSILMKNIKGELYWVNIFEYSAISLYNDFGINLDVPDTYKGKNFMLVYSVDGANKNYKLMLPLE